MHPWKARPLLGAPIKGQDFLSERQPQWIRICSTLSYVLITLVVVGRFLSFYYPQVLIAYKVVLVTSCVVALPLALNGFSFTYLWYTGWFTLAVIGWIQVVTIHYVSGYTVVAFAGCILCSFLYASSIASWEGLRRYTDAYLLAGVCNSFLCGYLYESGWSPVSRIGKITEGGMDYGVNNNELAFTLTTALLCGMLSVVLSKRLKQTRLNVFRWAGILLCGYMVLKTGSRGIGGAAFAAVAVNFIGSVVRPSAKLRTKILVAVLVLAGLGGVFSAAVYFKLPIVVRVQGDEGGQTMDSYSDLTRVDMISKALALFKENLVSGSGFDSFRYLSGYGTYSHNDFVEILCNEGLVGFGLYLGTLWLFFYQLQRVSKDMLHTWSLGLIAFITVSQLTLVIYLMFEYWLFMPCVVVLCRLSMRDFQKARAGNSFYVRNPRMR